MEARDREALLQKQKKLEAYLLENPGSSLFAWYARQNIEAGDLDRARKICHLGLQSGRNKGVLHKLLGEIYMARGEVAMAMKHLTECLLSRDPFPGVIIELIKHLGDKLSSEDISLLMYQLNQTLPGHPEAKRFFRKHPQMLQLSNQPDYFAFLEKLKLSLEERAKRETAALAVEEEEFTADIVTEEIPEKEKPIVEKAEKSHADAAADTGSQEKAVTEQKPEEKPRGKSPAARRPRPPRRKSDVSVKHNISRSMATFTLLQIFKDQGMYDHALEVLEFLKDKSSNTERIEAEEREIRTLMQQNNSKTT